MTVSFDRFTKLLLDAGYHRPLPYPEVKTVCRREPYRYAKESETTNSERYAKED